MCHIQAKTSSLNKSAIFVWSHALATCNASSCKNPFFQVGPGCLHRLTAWPVKFQKRVVVGGHFGIKFHSAPTAPSLESKSRMKRHATRNQRISKHNRQDNLMIKISCIVWSHALATCNASSCKSFFSSGTRLSALPALFSRFQFQRIDKVVKPY